MDKLLLEKIEAEKLKPIHDREIDPETMENYHNKYESLFKDRKLYGHFGSKSRYVRKYPNHKVIFNSTICMKDKYYDISLTWCDIDINKQGNKLQNISTILGREIYVVAEGLCNDFTSIKDLIEYKSFNGFLYNVVTFKPKKELLLENYYEELLDKKEDIEENINYMLSDPKYLPLTLEDYDECERYKEKLLNIEQMIENKEYFTL